LTDAGILIDMTPPGWCGGLVVTVVLPARLSQSSLSSIVCRRILMARWKTLNLLRRSGEIDKNGEAIVD
jgi:hypothetical protein